ncbi:BPSS1187 family protein [Lacisediminihabitans changchengi]|uniref:Alpha/beta fold hydrolase n=1 Tax=Lacisediminihabitans changchengi TaxID=2787634 RepID=A0A934W3M3_9MICO|nr:alpha/beta fold hydrolase [Lacisediminihabitans changchengi]MBK4346831.1 alpha/beta fold hydrolase [Lacisediminihabitans changchengi]MBK4348046.1 alpha/beta fold hydrolase [Lacisediminihabitans changchengi]
MRTGRRLAIIAAALCVVLSCTVAQAARADTRDHATTPDHDGPGSSLISFRLPETGDAFLSPNARNFAVRGTKGSPLLLFLPATRSVPRDYRSFLDTAASLGYHVLALDYPNRGQSVVHLCAGAPRCYGEVQRNRFQGGGQSAFNSVDRRDSILNRLRMSLDHLQFTDPGGAWSRYRSGDSIRWDRVVVAGHSQGGGLAAYIAHRFRVHGALMFSSPVQSDAGVPARWMRKSGATPASVQYGLVDVRDRYATNVTASWATMGMTGTHAIVSELDLGSPSDSHLRTVTDRSPRVDGVPVLAPTWRWMLEQVR